MQERLNSAVPELDWEQINPLLNTVMLELGESDREVLLLRFFERRSLAEVGSQLGLTENTARMRVERALERLRGRLTRRGVTSTAAGLALALAHQAVSAAPLGLAASITAASLASGVTVSGSSILTLIAMTHAKAVIVGAVIAAGAVTPAFLQHRANTRLQAELDVARAQLLERAPSPTVSADPDELARTRREHDELIRLRGDLALLRQRAVSTPKGPSDASEFDRLKATKLDRLAQEAVDAQRLLAKAPEIPMLPANSWTNQGVGTPLAALQTLNWAAAHKDTNALLSAISWDPQVKARADELFAALPEDVRQRYGSLDSVMFDWLITHATPTTSYRVLSQTEQGPDDMTLLEQHQYSDDRVRENSVPFHRDENGAWRQVLPPELMPKLEMVINHLADAPFAGAK